MTYHYNKEREREVEERMLNGSERKPKINRRGEIVFLLALAFIVVSLIFLF